MAAATTISFHLHRRKGTAFTLGADVAVRGRPGEDDRYAAITIDLDGARFTIYSGDGPQDIEALSTLFRNVASRLNVAADLASEHVSMESVGGAYRDEIG